MDNSADYLKLFLEPVKEFLDDEHVSEILINGPAQIYVERKGKLQLTPAHFGSDMALHATAVNIARSVGRILSEEYPILEARLPDGSRVEAVIPPLSRVGTVISIRKFSKDKLTMADLVRYGSISPAGAQLIEVIVKLHKNVMVSGATSSGKTSVLDVLSSFISAEERILVIEDASELQLQQQHVVSFETRKPDRRGHGAVTIRDLVQASLRLRPDRIVIGEIRGGEALDLLQALNTGHSGSMSTIHANSARDSLSRLETCALMSGLEMPLAALRTQVGSAIHVVVQTARLSDGTRKITGVSEVLGLEGGEYKMQDLLMFKTDRVDEKMNIIGRHVGTGNRPTFLDAARMVGLDLDEKMFAAAGPA